MSTAFLCGLNQTKVANREYTQQSITTASSNHQYPQQWPSNHFNQIDTSLSNLEEAHLREPSASPSISINRKRSHSFNEKQKQQKQQKQRISKLSINMPQNQFNLNYHHGHIANHPSPRTATPKSSNPFELILDQKKLHKIIKSMNYPYLSWHWFEDRFEPVIDVQRRQNDPGPVILRMDGKTYPKCIPCWRENMDRHLFDDESVYNMVKWALRLFVCYCAEYQHDCTWVKKSKMYKDKLQQSIAQSKALLKDKMKLQRQTDMLYRQISKHESSESEIEELRHDLNVYKASSKHWKRECIKEKKMATNTLRDFEELLKKSNHSQFEYDEMNKRQKQIIFDLNEEKNEFVKLNLDLNEKCNELQTKIDEITVTNEENLTLINEQNEAHNVTMNELNDLKNEYDELLKKMEKMTKNESMQQEKIQKMEEKMCELKQNNEKFEDQMNDLLIKELKNEKESKQNEAAFALSMEYNLRKIKECETKIDELKCEKSQIQKERERDVENLRQTFEKTHVCLTKYENLCSLNDELSKELSTLKDENFSFRQKNEKITKELTKLEEFNESEIKKQNEKMQFMQQQLDKLIKERDLFKNENSEKKYNDLMKCYKEQKTELMELKLRHSQFEDMNIKIAEAQNKKFNFESCDTPTAIARCNEMMEVVKNQSQQINVNKDNAMHPIWNLFDWYNDEQNLQVIDDILSGDAEDNAISDFFDSLRVNHSFIHEALVNNEWNIWKFVNECTEISDYNDALRKLLDEHPRVYAAIQAEQLLNDLEMGQSELYNDEEVDKSDDDEDYYQNDDDTIFNLQQYEEEEFKEDDDEIKTYDHLKFGEIKISDSESSNAIIYGFECHPEYGIAFLCDSDGYLKQYQMKKGDVRLLKGCNMRQDVFADDHRAFCCAISPLGDYVAFGGGFDDESKVVIVCYKIKSKRRIELNFVIENDEEMNGPIRSIEFDETGKVMFVGNDVGNICLFDINGQFLQNVTYEKNEEIINDFCFYSNHIFILTKTLCFSYLYDAQNEINKIDPNTLKIIAQNDKKNGDFECISVTQNGDNELIVFIASHVLECYILSIQENDYKNNAISKICEDECDENENEQIVSLHLDHKRGYLLVSRRKNVKICKINGVNLELIKCVKSEGIAGCAVNYKYDKYVSICHQKPCSIEMKKVFKK